MAADRGIGLSPMADLTLTTPKVGVPVRKLTWSIESATPRREEADTPPCRTKLKMSARGNLLRRLNSEPSPTAMFLMDPCGKENSNILQRSPKKMSSNVDVYDPCSQDSGCTDLSADGRFVMSTVFGAKRVLEPSPAKSGQGEDEFSPNFVRFCSSSTLNDSFDDGFIDVSEDDKPDENAPASLGNLLTGEIISAKTKKPDSWVSPITTRQPLRRALSLVESNIDTTNGLISRVRDGSLGFKKPHELAPNTLKRRKSGTLTDAPRNKLQRSISETVPSSNLTNLDYGKQGFIADFSRPYALPIVTGKHIDLTSISAETLAGVIRGEYRDKIFSYTVIDCRYPYEFEGGHIRGAINLYTFDLIEDNLLKAPEPITSNEYGDANGRNILIFHCEFSAVRGPSMYRLLRRLDRQRNGSAYPTLQYPEVYLLNGGYEMFHSQFTELCEPTGYRPMKDPSYEADLRKFRGRSTSWTGGRSSFKRLGLF